MKKFAKATLVAAAAAAALVGTSTTASASTWEVHMVYAGGNPGEAHAKCIAKGKELVKSPYIYSYRCVKSQHVPDFQSTLWILVN